MNTKASSSWVLPATTEVIKQGKDDCTTYPFSFGLHLIPGAGASGKTVTALGLAFALRELGVPSHYEYVMEPRSPEVLSLLKPGQWSDKLEALLASVRNGVLIVDSLTYLVSRLNELEELKDDLTKVTFSGGLSPLDIAGVLTHDSLARKHNVALIATLNSELFPVIDRFYGACEGQFILGGVGQFQHRDRGTRRFDSYTLPTAAMEAAFKTLGYEKPQVSKVDRY